MANLTQKARNLLEDSITYYQQKPVGTCAAKDPQLDPQNYDQVFVRDFVPSAIAFLIEGNTEIVKNFLSVLLELQTQERYLDCFQPEKGMMPASFKADSTVEGKEVLDADYGQKAIGRVSPIDSNFWWLYILRIYTQATGDTALAAQPDFQKGIRSILQVFLGPQYEFYPTLLVPEGAFMIDRRMGVYGHPLDMQTIFLAGLRSAQELLDLSDEKNQDYIQALDYRLSNLAYHLRKYYWLENDKINQIYRYSTEELGSDVVNQFNIYPETIPEWLMDWLDNQSGYFAGNLGPARLDFRFFCMGNLMAIITSLASTKQSKQILQVFESNWQDLIGRMPLKIVFPAITGRDWEIMTGHDSKNTAWSYHNGANWPVLLWFLAVAEIKTGGNELTKKALEILEARIDRDDWPEYYDGKTGKFIGKQARKFQTWSIAGYLVVKKLLESPENINWICFTEEIETEEE